MNRRKFLAGIGSGGLIGITGCTTTRPGTMRITSDSAYFKSIKYTPRAQIFLGGDESHATVFLHSDTPQPITAVVMIHDGNQIGVQPVGTGESKVHFNQWDLPDYADVIPTYEFVLVAIKDGREEGNQWINGTVLEKVPVIVNTKDTNLTSPNESKKVDQ